MAVTFDIQFRISVSTKVIRLTDTSSGFTYGKGCFKVVFPNGVVRNLPDYSTPDITASVRYIDVPCELDASGNVITGSYSVSFTAVDNLSVGQTPLTRTFDFNWIEPTNGLTNLSDVLIPEVVFSDVTSYSPVGSFTGVLTRTLSSSFPSTSEVSGSAPITSTSTNTIRLVSATNYYEGVYTPTSAVSVAYTHSSNAWLTILYTRTFSATYAIKKCPSQLELVTKINAYRAIIDVYKTTNDTQFNILSNQYDLVIALYSHLIARYDTTTQDGSEPILRELLSILEPYSGTYTYQSTRMFPFELAPSVNNSLVISDGTNTDTVTLGSTLTFASGNAALVPIVTNNNVTYSPTFGTLINTFAQGNDSRFHNPVTIGTANGLSISTQALSLAAATTGSAGAMSSSDKTKLDGIASGATANTGTVTSVALSVPAAFSVSGSPVTTTGTLAISATGTSLQYITGTGALATLNTANVPENTNLYFTSARARTSIALTTTGTSGAATYDNATGIINIPNYVGGVTSFNTRTGAIVLSGSDVTTALSYTPYNATNPSGYISSITSGNVTGALGYTPENAANKGIANGYASLDGGGLVPSTQLPSYVDDVLEFANLAALPATGETGKIYVALDNNKIYRWSGATYIEVSPTVGTIWGGITGTLSNQTDLQNALNAKQATLSGTGFVKSTSGTISYDTNTYLTTSSATTTYVPYTGASGNVNLGTNNISANNFLNAFSNITASATQVVLTVSSAPEIVVNGSGGQVIKLPDATTLASGASFLFNNNQSSGAITVNNNSNTLVVSVPSGGYCELILIDNSIAAGSWDRHFEAPANVSWSTNTFDYAGSITSATWNGNVVQPNRGGTGQSTYTDGQLLIGNTSGNTLSKATLTAGTGITITNGNGSISIANSGVTGSGTTNTIPKFTSSTAIGNSSITDTGSLVTIANPLTLSGAVTGVGNISNYTVTASSGTATSKRISSTLVASANGDALIGLDINPTFTTGSFTNTTSLALRVNGNISPYTDNTKTIGLPTFRFSDVYAVSGRFSNGVITNLAAANSSGISFMSSGFTQYGQLFNSTGNLTLQNGGTFTDAGYRLDVAGTTRFQGTTASDTAPLGSELAGVTGTGTNWALASGATNLNVGGYIHTVGSTTALTTSLAAVSGTYYQTTYTITGRTAGSIAIAYGGTSTSASSTGNTGPLASSTAVLTITPTTDFDGTVVLSIKSIGVSSASSTFANSSGTSNIEVRASSVISNTFIGGNSGRRITTGIQNTFIGNDAGSNNTTGVTNTFIGQGAGFNNTTGVSNSFIGTSAGVNNTTGGFNTFIGTAAGQQNTIGISNTFVGQGAGNGNTTASSNTFIGYISGYSNTTGDVNVFIGNSAGYSNTTGVNNVSIGSNAGQSNTTGSNNVFFGRNAGRFISDGSTANAVTSNSIYIGLGTKALASAQANQIVIGLDATGLGSNTTVLGNSSTVITAIYGNLLLGSTVDSGFKLDVTGTARVSGVLTLSSTISNGTYTYTLPSATGTLALTSALSGYLPLTGGTLTGALGGTSATFSGNVSSSNQLRLEPSANATLVIGSRSSQTDFQIYNTGNIFRIYNGTNDALSIATGAGAATFSSSVTAGGVITSDSSSTAALPATSGSTQSGGHRLRLTTNGASTAVIDYGTAGGSGGWIQAAIKDSLGTSLPLLLNPNGGNVGIGTSSPRAILDISDGTVNTSGEGIYQGLFTGPSRPSTSDLTAILTIQSNDAMAINKGGSIAFGGRAVTSSSAGANWAGIGGLKENGTGSDYTGYLQFWTRGGSSSEKMRIGSTGFAASLRTASDADSKTFMNSVNATCGLIPVPAGTTLYLYNRDSSTNYRALLTSSTYFTGQHGNKPVDLDLKNNIENYIGMIVSSAGTYYSVNPITKEVTTGKDAISISEALPEIKLTNIDKDKSVWGVVTNVRNDNYNTDGTVETDNNTEWGDRLGSNVIRINGLGEGAIWVTNINGNIENGDFICSSSIAGYGRKQDDDILRNYTVAKITMNCDFDLNNNLYKCEEFEFQGKIYKKAFVGCTYHCS